MHTAHDPTITSYYVTEELYRELVENFTNWQRSRRRKSATGSGC